MTSSRYFYFQDITIIFFIIINTAVSYDEAVTEVNIFKKLVHKNLFVDKSQFIEEFVHTIDESKVMVITRPKGFGKSINLEMLKTFFGVEVNQFGDLLKTKNNQKYFTNLKISKNEEILKYQGKHPVIYLSFENVNGSTYNEIVDEIELAIRKSFIEHKYLLDVTTLDKDDIKFLRRINCNQDKLTRFIKKTCFKYLSEFLHAHFGERSFFFVDDFDKPLYQAYFKSNCSELQREKLIKSIIGIFSEVKNSEQVKKSFLCGTTQLPEYASLIGFDYNQFHAHNILHKKFSLSFGFTEEEVTGLLKKLNKSNLQKNIKQWCGGYRSGGITELYNPWLVMEYIQNENNKLGDNNSIFTDDDLVSLKKAFDSCDHSKNMQNVLYSLKNVSWIMDYARQVSFDEFEDQKAGDFFDSIAVHFGFLSLTKNKNLANKYFVRIPNLQVQNIFEKLLKNWISQQTCVPDSEMVKTGDMIFEVLDKRNFTELINRLDLFFPNLFKRVKDMNNSPSYEMNKELWLDSCVYLFMLDSKYSKNFKMFRRKNGVSENDDELDIAADLILIPLKDKGSEAYLLNCKVTETVKSATFESERIATDKTNNEHKILNRKFPYIKTLCNVSMLFEDSTSKIQMIHKTINL